MYKNVFEKLKLQSKILYFRNKLKQYENNIKNTWKIMKVIIGKSKVYNDNFPIIPFESYLSNITTSSLDKPLNQKEFKGASFGLKANKSPGVKSSVNKYFQSIIKNRNFF